MKILYSWETMKHLYEGIEKPKIRDILKFNYMKYDDFAKSEFKRLSSHYKDSGMLFIRLKGAMHGKCIDRALFEALNGLCIGCVITLQYTELSQLTPLFIFLFIVCWALSRFHYQTYKLLDSISFQWFQNENVKLQELKLKYIGLRTKE